MVINLNRRHREILSIILNTDECITGNELAKLCNVSIRTIRRDMKEINLLLEEYNMKIGSNVKKGYYLNKENKDSLKKNNIIRKVLDYEYIIEIPSLPMDRQIYILSKLTTKEYISVEELAKTLYVSTATINNDITFINKWLKRDLNLSISYSLNNGITLKANEKEKRNIISWILSIRTNISTILKFWNYLFEDIEIIEKTKDIYHIVSAEAKKDKYYLAGHSLQIMCYEILVAIIRCNLGFKLNSLEKTNDILMPVMVSISEKVEEELLVKLPQIEWLNLQQCFKSKQFLKGTDIRDIETDECISIVDEFLKILNNKFKLDLSANLDNKYKLRLYVASMINRLKYRYCIPNKINEKVTEVYKREFKMATEMAQIIKRELDLNMELIELAYITIHLVSICKLWRYSLNTAIVCDYDESIISFIKDKIKNHFGDKINISKNYTYWELVYGDQENFKDIDFIITTSTIADITKIPFIKINPEIESNDINMIAEYLENYKSKTST